MARKKVNLQWITNTLIRRATFRRRCKGLMKKASELTTLCGAKACVVVYGEGKVQPEVWPSIEEARGLLTKYKNMPELVNFKKTENQKDFLSSRLAKLRGQVSKSESENYEREALDLLHERMNKRRLGLFGTSTEELTRLQKIVQERSNKAKERLQQLGAGLGAPMESPMQLLPGSSSSQPHDDHPYPGMEMQVLVQPEEQQTQQQDWPVDMAPNGGDAGSLPCSDFLGSSNGSAGPSSSGGNMVQPYSPGSYSRFPWALEWDSFPPME
ncbi:unnamed protein product [Urochloa decumbens]|uniref:MADS-box domain-containing protein n=1 Tax=Urochloa decumbens TaxID=240449 RepID=A0ABC9AER8_9POAL